MTVEAATTAELRRKRDEVVGADLIELRLDSVGDPTVAGALADRRSPVIVTCRPTWEGGHFTGSEEERRRLLGAALDQGAEFVDVEWHARFDDLIARTGGRRIVLSMHDFEGVPADLGHRAREMRATGAEVIKLAVETRRLDDCIPLLHVGAQYRESGAVVIGMGESGIATRVLAHRFGSRWTYAGGQESAGQLTPDTLLTEFGFRSISEATEVYGLVGSPVAHSVSPAMHNAAFRAVRRDAVYLPLRAADPDDVLRFGRAIGLSGASVTIPFKVALFDRMDEVFAVARRIGAINTFNIVQGRWIGGNTDAAAFLHPLTGHVALSGVRVSLLGAGGAARAAAVALAPSGASVTVHARNRSRAEEVALITASAAVGPWPPRPNTWDVLVNCTPIGMFPDVGDTPLPAADLTGRCVYDLIYNPPTTRLMLEAERAGCQVIGGLEMLVAQAHEQFEWWTGMKAPTGVMREAARKRLSEFTANEDHVV